MPLAMLRFVLSTTGYIAVCSDSHAHHYHDSMTDQVVVCVNGKHILNHTLRGQHLTVWCIIELLNATTERIGLGCKVRQQPDCVGFDWSGGRASVQVDLTSMDRQLRDVGINDQLDVAGCTLEVTRGCC